MYMYLFTKYLFCALGRTQFFFYLYGLASILAGANMAKPIIILEYPIFPNFSWIWTLMNHIVAPVNKWQSSDLERILDINSEEY